MTSNNKDFASHKMGLAKIYSPIIFKPIDISTNYKIKKKKEEAPGFQIICVPRIIFLE